MSKPPERSAPTEPSRASGQGLERVGIHRGGEPATSALRPMANHSATILGMARDGLGGWLRGIARRAEDLCAMAPLGQVRAR